MKKCPEVSTTLITADHNTAITLPTPTRTGYSFKGWYTATTEGTKREYTTMPNLTETLYAQWEDIAVGAPVTYSYTSGSYTFNNSLAQNEGTGITTLSGANYQLSSWKVLSVSNDKKTIEIVPSSPTTGTLTLQGYQGYNNAVKLLNDACSGLFDGDGSGTKITARSVSMEDIEPLLDSTALNTAKTNSGYDTTTAKGPYTVAFSHYPLIYADEFAGTLGRSIQNSFITSNGRVDGSSLSVYYTAYNMEEGEFSRALGVKSSLFLNSTPSETLPYWVATRWSLDGGDAGYFGARFVVGGDLICWSLYMSGSASNIYQWGLFPIVTLDTSLLNGDNTGFTVDMSNL